MSASKFILALAATASLAACGDTLGKQALGGAAIGAGAAAITGGSLGTGAAVGAGANVLACQTKMVRCN